jgi:hypothetical protein
MILPKIELNVIQKQKPLNSIPVLGMVKFAIVAGLFYTFKQDFLMNVNIFLPFILYPVLYSLKKSIKERTGQTV